MVYIIHFKTKTAFYVIILRLESFPSDLFLQYYSFIKMEPNSLFQINILPFRIEGNIFIKLLRKSLSFKIVFYIRFEYYYLIFLVFDEINLIL